MVAFTFALPTGIPGAVNRAQSADVTAEQINTGPAADTPTAYGVGVVVDAAGLHLPAAGAVIAGFYVRPYPTQGGGPVSGIVNDPLGTSTPPTSGIGNVLRRGRMIVRMGTGAAAVVKGQAAEVSVTGATRGHVFGAGDAGAGAGAIAMPSTTFVGPADAGGITEIAFNI